MMVNKVDDAINECKKHLQQKEAFGTEIEAFLTRYLLILISSSFEEELEKIFIERVNISRDTFLIEYFRGEIPNKLKSVGISKLSQFVSRFGNKYSEKFKSEISGTREATLYGNLIRNRHLVAHETQEPTMTFNEVVNAYQESKVIIDKIKKIIND